MTLPKNLLPEYDEYKRMPYYPLVPKTPIENLKFRQKVFEDGRRSRASAEQIWRMCAADFLFWLNLCGVIFEPRPRSFLTLGEEEGLDNIKEIPFITWPFQDVWMPYANHCIEKGKDLVITKSRDTGASWGTLAVYLWRWLFKDMNTFLVVSRKEEYVDKTGDPKTLFFKLRYLLKKLPMWLKPQVGDALLSLRNLSNGSTIDGESTNSDVARGDRRTSILMDEFAAVENGAAVLAATRDATSCRIFVSTPNGKGNAHYDVTYKRPYLKVWLHWSLHPDKAKGLYWKDQMPRSPWYDKECEDRVNPVEIAKELDLDFEGSEYLFFPSILTEKLTITTVRKPVSRGAFPCNEKGESQGYEPSDKGELQLWITLEEKGRPPPGRRYVIGADLSQGTGASVSCLKVADETTGEVVAEWSSPFMDPLDLGEIGYGLGMWFNEAFFCWEANGPGRSFGRKVMELGYRNVYYARVQEKRMEFMDKAPSGVPGWYNAGDLKPMLMREYRKALNTSRFIERSLESVEELKCFVVQADGSIIHQASATTDDPTGARENHGDRATAGMLTWFGCCEMAKGRQGPGASELVLDQEAPEGSMAWRMNQRAAMAGKSKSW